MTASNLKSFMMDLAVLSLNDRSPVSGPVMEQGITHLCIMRDKTFISKVLF